MLICGRVQRSIRRDLVLWRQAAIRVDAFHKCEQHVVLMISELTGRPCLLSRVYASREYRE